MLRLLTFLALVASASATGTCKVGNNGQCSSFDGQNIKSAFPSNCYVPLATGACGSDSWLIFLNTFAMTFNVRYEGFIYTVANGTTFSRAEFSVAVTAAGSVATITATTVPSNTCGLCNNNGKPQCLSPLTTTPLPTTTEVVTTPVPTTSAPPSTCTVFTSGKCSDFNGCNSTTTFPNNTNIPLAMGACEGETWVVFYSTITMSFSIIYEGFIYPCHAGNKTTYGSVSVEVNIELTMAIILVDDLPSGLTCGLCSSSGSVECSGSPQISSTPAQTTTEELTTTEEATTSVVTTSPPVSTCSVSTTGQCTGFDGCKSITTFPNSTNIPLAMGACEGETWVVFYSTITMSFSIRFEGFIYPCNGGNVTTFGEVSVEVNVEMTLALIMVKNMPADITCGLCSSSETVECESTALPPSVSPVVTTEEATTTEEVTTAVSTSEPSTKVSPSTCVVSKDGECTGFNGCKSSTTTFPNNTEIVLARGDCESDDTWFVFFSTITITFNIKFEGFIYPCNAGNKTVFGSVSVEVNIEVTMAIILVDDITSGISCGVCGGSESVECSSTSDASVLTEEPTTTEEFSTSVAITESSTEIPPSTCIVSKEGECTGFNGCSSTTAFPPNSEIVLARGDCESEDTWIVLFSTITMSFNIKFEGFIHACSAGNKTTFGSVSVEVNTEVTMAIILVDNMPSGISCGLCGSETVECSSTSVEALASTEESTTSEEPTTTDEVSIATSETSSEMPASTCIVSKKGECTGFNGCSSTTTFPPNSEIVLARGDCESEDTWFVFFSTITMTFNIKFEGFIYPCHPGNKTVFGSVSVEVNIEVTMAIILVADMPSGIDCGLCGSETVECSSSTPALISTEEPVSTSSVANTEKGDCGCPGFCMITTSGDAISFDGSEFNGDFPDDCIVPLASSDCGDEKKWQILLSKATSSFFLVVDGEIIVLGFGSIYVKYELTVFVTYQTVFIVLPNKSVENDCSVCGKPEYKECIDFPGLPSTPYPWVTKAPSTIPPCVFPSSLSP